MRKRSLSRVTLKRMILEEMMRINEKANPESFKRDGNKFTVDLYPDRPGEGEEPVMGYQGNIVNWQGSERAKKGDKGMAFGYGEEGGPGSQRSFVGQLDAQVGPLIRGEEPKAMSMSKPKKSSSRVTKKDAIGNALAKLAMLLTTEEQDDALDALAGALEDARLGIGEIEDVFDVDSVEGDFVDFDPYDYEDDLGDVGEIDLEDEDDEDPFA
jgi:hypothetical protein